MLGIWGPIIVSVGNLLTIVLVLISDVSHPTLRFDEMETRKLIIYLLQCIFGAGIDTLTIWSLLGSGGIVLAFGVLAYDMFIKRS